MLEDQLDQIDMRNDWGYHPLDYERSQWGYVGLKNQGATCYMNSLLQQLYHTPCRKTSKSAIIYAIQALEEGFLLLTTSRM